MQTQLPAGLSRRNVLNTSRRLGVITLIAMLTAASIGYADLPDMPNVPQPNPAPAAPSGWDVFTPPVTSAPPASGSPTIAEWTRTGVSDDSLILTGNAFSNNAGVDAGDDTMFVVYGQTGNSDSIQSTALIQRLDGLKAAITLPTGLPAWSTYFLWPKNSSGYGYPVGINRTEAWWVGPDQATQGDTVSIYGRNLSHNGGTTTSWVYIQQAGAAGQWATVTSVNPYRVQFTVPTTLSDGVTPFPNGTYQVWIHNGHGGNYGWGGPLTLTVQAPFAWESDPASIFNVKDYGAKGDGVTDDFNAINAADVAASSYAYINGYGALARPATLYFPAGTYMMSQGVGINSGFHFMGDGMNSTFLKCNGGFLTPQSQLANPAGHNGLFFGNGGTLFNVEFSGLTLDANGNFNPNAAGTGDGGSLLNGGWSSITNFALSDVGIKVDRPGIYCASLTAMDHASIVNCTFSGGDLFLFQGSKQSVNNCNFFEAKGQEEAILQWGISNLSITDCTAKDTDINAPGWDNFIVGNAAYGTETNVYIGDNSTVLGPPPGSNSGAAVLSEGTHAWYQGTPTAATATTVTFSDLATNSLSSAFVTAIDNNTLINEYTATIASGTGLGQYRLITNYDGSNTITVSPAWNVAPDPSSVVLIGRAADKWVVYHNTFQGKSYYATDNIGMAGIQPNAGGYEWIGDNNTITQMNTALIAQASEWNTQNGQTVESAAPCYFIYYANNTIQDCYEGIRAGFGTAQVSPSAGIGFLGNVFRNNSVSDITTDGAYASTDAGATIPLDMTLFEHNTFTNLSSGINLDNNVPGTINGVHSSTKNVILYKNSFSLGTAAYAGSYGIYFGPETLAPSLIDNTWTDFATTYAGTPPGAILDLPLRNFNVSGTTASGTQDATLTIWDSGTAPLNWAATSDSSWLTLSSGSGTVADEDSNSTLTFTCDPTGLSPGTYTGTITVSGGTQPETFTVNFTIPPTPVPAMPTWAFLSLGVILFAVLGVFARRRPAAGNLRSEI
jgi:hypothetical protein